MQDFEIGDRVKIAGTDFVGTVESHSETTGVIVILFDDGERAKITLPDARIIPAEERAEITVNSAKFQEVAIKTIIEESEDDINVMMAYAVFVSKLHKALFGFENDG